MTVALTIFMSLVVQPSIAEGPTKEVPVRIVSARASSHLKPFKGYTFDASNLIDGRVDTSWQPAKSNTLGVGQWVELDLGQTIEVARIEIAQGLQKTDPKLGDLYCRNNRLASAEVWLDDGTVGRIDRGYPPTDLTLEVLGFYRGFANTPGHEVKTAARRLRLVVAEVLEPVEWTDLAVAEIRVFGRPVDAPSVDPVAIAWDRPGSWPFRAAVLDYCAVDEATRGARRCGPLLQNIGPNYFGLARPTPLPPLDPAAVLRGAVQLAFGEEQHVRLDFRKDPSGDHWVVETGVITNRDGSPVERSWETWYSPDIDRDNPCWEKLGKKRKSYD